MSSDKQKEAFVHACRILEAHSATHGDRAFQQCVDELLQVIAGMNEFKEAPPTRTFILRRAKGRHDMLCRVFDHLATQGIITSARDGHNTVWRISD